MTVHLGDLLVALVDGTLDHDHRDRALGHVAGCDSCRSELEAQRRVKVTLAEMRQPEVPFSLLARLELIEIEAVVLRFEVQCDQPGVPLRATGRSGRIPASRPPGRPGHALRSVGRVARVGPRSRRIVVVTAGGVAALALSFTGSNSSATTAPVSPRNVVQPASTTPVSFASPPSVARYPRPGGLPTRGPGGAVVRVVRDEELAHH
jgi:hypothetical protein